MRLMSLLCVIFLLVPIFSIQTVSAQPDFEVGDWDIGFKDGENDTFSVNPTPTENMCHYNDTERVNLKLLAKHKFDHTRHSATYICRM